MYRTVSDVSFIVKANIVGTKLIRTCKAEHKNNSNNLAWSLFIHTREGLKGIKHGVFCKVTDVATGRPVRHKHSMATSAQDLE